MTRAIWHLVRGRHRAVHIPHDDYAHKIVRYGQGITGWPAAGITIHDAPETMSERDWMVERLLTFLAPGGRVLLPNGEQFYSFDRRIYELIKHAANSTDR